MQALTGKITNFMARVLVADMRISAGRFLMVAALIERVWAVALGVSLISEIGRCRVDFITSNLCELVSFG